MKIFSAKIVQIIFLLISQSVCFAQNVPLEVKGEGVRSIVTKFPAFVHAPEGFALQSWTVPPNFIVKDKGPILEIVSAPKGEHTITVKLVQVDWDKRTFTNKFGEIVILIGIGPGPGPTPPDPVPPDPSPAPIPVEGNRVLIVYETNQALPPKQSLILTSQTFRDFLDEKCIMGPDGKTKEWRMFDQDEMMTNSSKLWQDAMKRVKGNKVPWIMISTGKTGFEGPLPATIEETIALIKKYFN